jgi:7-cyano-7-deazaguanine tRNA-ribosyltransferase
MFEIRKKDGLARIGILTTNHGRISTPVLLPVINPSFQLLPPSEMVSCGAEAFITNAYLLFRDQENHEKVLKEGLHEYIGFSGPLMTDSGAFQLMGYGKVSVTNQEITNFQEKIGTDIGVFLDVPTKGGTYSEFNLALEETLKRANEHIQCRDPSTSILWAGPIQGGEHLDLIAKSSKEMRKKDFHIHPIGSVVPILEKYDFETVIRMILTAKKHLPINRPIHLFGAGHPIFFAIAVLLGIDIFDSAAYVLYAKKNRYITEFGTDYLENMQYLPCSCDVCINYTINELKKLDHPTRTKLLAKHNLIKSLEEIRRIKQAIIEGRLYELALSRAMNHPSLTKTLNLIFGISTSQNIEPYDPVSKMRSLLITHPILMFQPILLRYRQRIMERFYSWNSKLLIVQDYQRYRSSESYQIIKLSPLFGVIPDELHGVYPLVQYERIPLEYTTEINSYISQFLENNISRFEKLEIHPSINLNIEIFNQFSVSDKIEKGTKQNDIHKVNAIMDYQFGYGVHKIFNKRNITIERSRKTGIIRRFSDELGLLGTFRASDFSIIPTTRLAQQLHQYLSYPKRRVVAESESIPFVLNNKDLLARFVQDVDPEVRSGEEVIIVDNHDNYINFGKSVLSAKEMIEFDRGVAVQVRS